MIKTYYATSGTGTPLTGKSFVLKDRAGALPDVPMTELGAGHYTADLPIGTAWNIYDGANPTDVVVDALLAQAKEPIVSSGNPAHAYFGNKAFRAINISDVTNLASSLNSQSAHISQLLVDVQTLDGYIQDLRSPVRTFEFGGKTYSMDPITVMHQPGIIDGSASKHYYLLKPAAGGHPYTVSVPGDGSWVDAFRIAFDGEVEFTEVDRNFTPRGLLHHLNSVIIIGNGNRGNIPYLDFRYSVLESSVGVVYGTFAPYNQVGSSVIAKQLAYTNMAVGGSDGYIQHSVRDIGAALSSCGGFLKLKIEVRLKSPGAPVSMTFTNPTTAHVSAQLYPEVP